MFQEKTDVEPTLTTSLERGKETIIKISTKVNEYQTQHQVIFSSDDSNDFISRPRFGLVEVVYEWARGMSFNRITDLTDVLEGTIVRVITRLDETCREVKNAARIIGDPQLFTKMQSAQEMIKRDIVSLCLSCRTIGEYSDIPNRPRLPVCICDTGLRVCWALSILRILTLPTASLCFA